jgi:hypothetical protein
MSDQRREGWAKRQRAPHFNLRWHGGHGAKCAFVHLQNFKQHNTVIASVSEAIHRAAKQEWIASSLSLLAMTARYESAISPRDFFARGIIFVLPFKVRAQGMPGA